MAKVKHCCETLSGAVKRDKDIGYRSKRYFLLRQRTSIDYCPFCAKKIGSHTKNNGASEEHCCSALKNAVIIPCPATSKKDGIRFRFGIYTLQRQGIPLRYCPFCSTMLPQYAEHLRIIQKN